MWTELLRNPFIVPTLISAATWLWHRFASGKHATQIDIVSGAVRSILAEIVDHVPDNVPLDTYLKGARDYVERRIWNVLSKRGIPDNAITRGLVHAAIEQATSELATQIAAERRKKVAGES